ncbi:MAG: serine hydrolase, partial [Cyanobacteria bacterium J06632_22]
ARDWAKFGLLYLQDGCWQGERILPSGWVDYSTTPGQIDPRYGAHFWRQVPFAFRAQDGTSEETDALWPGDAYLASGYQGQFVTIIPSSNLVVVRLGLSQKRHSWDHPQFISKVLQAISA